MKKLSATLLGVVILSAALSSAVTPAFALGGCGPNGHRGPYGGCRWGGQNQAWCLRVGFESHEARAIRRRSSMTDAA